jgi:hypothetical protein
MGWMLILIEKVVVPSLSMLADELVKRAKVTPGTTDDILASSFHTVIEALKTKDIQDLIIKK